MEIYMIKEIYKTRLIQNKEEIYKEKTYIERDIQRENLYRKKTYIERIHIQNKDKQRKKIHREGIHGK